MLNINKSVILSNVGNCSDRYCPEYSKPFTLSQLFDRTKSIEGVTGVELVSSWHITAENVKEVKVNLLRTGLKPISIIPDHFGEEKWKMGAFTNKDAGIRKDAVDLTKQLMDIAVEIGCPLISLWPGQDGYDYMFQGDYIKERTWFEEGVAGCCEYNKDMKVSIEYKPKEPRIHSYPSNVFSTLLMVKEIGAKNCGVTIDYGHATTAYENVAESVAILKKYGDKLFHVHMNDNYCLWDDDMITGTVHTIPYLEFFWWLKKTGYAGWVSTDQYPYREDGRDATNESVRWFDIFVNAVNSMDDREVEEMVASGNSVNMSQFMRRTLFPQYYKG